MAGSLGTPILAASAPVLSCTVQVRTSARTYSTRNELSRRIPAHDAKRYEIRADRGTASLDPSPYICARKYHARISKSRRIPLFCAAPFFVAQIAFLVAQPRLAVHSAAPSGTGAPRHAGLACIVCRGGERGILQRFSPPPPHPAACSAAPTQVAQPLCRRLWHRWHSPLLDAQFVARPSCANGPQVNPV